MTLPPVSALAPRAASSAPETIGTPLLWGIVLLGVVALLALDFLLTRKPHAVSMREAVGWSVFYVALPLAFGGYVLLSHGQEAGLEYSPATWSRSP
jgi:heme A synthase